MKRLLIFIVILSLSGCAISDRVFPQPPEADFLVGLDDTEVFAVRPDGDMIAYVDAGLNLLRLSDQSRQRLTVDNPQALTWSPDGQFLVAAFREAEKTRLVRFSSSAADRPQILIDEQITDFAWLNDGRLLAIAQIVSAEQALLQIEARLLIWDAQWDVERLPLYNKRFNYRADRFDDPVMHRFDLASLKDELVYNRYLDPPAPDGRVELVLYNLLTGRELVLARNSQRQSEAFFAADAETLLLPDGPGVVKLYNPWDKSVIQQWSSRGESLQAAVGRNLFFIDGQLYPMPEKPLVLPEGSTAQFSADASQLFVAWQRKLYHYSGYQLPEKFSYSGIEKVKLQRIRQMRSLGEISLREYRQRRNNILNP